jgi:hypothetical protein
MASIINKKIKPGIKGINDPLNPGFFIDSAV